MENALLWALNSNDKERVDKKIIKKYSVGCYLGEKKNKKKGVSSSESSKRIEQKKFGERAVPLIELIRRNLNYSCWCTFRNKAVLLSNYSIRLREKKNSPANDG